MNFLDNINFLKDQIPDSAWQIINDLTDQVDGNGEIVTPYIDYIHTKLNIVDGLLKKNTDNETLILNRSNILLMITQLELVRMC